ncbi:MAG TPA: hypothetical protein VHM19_19625 [Polyangiales bacterium]|jgi:hypothetical protein|nr:hypothetical protein [Polyangiales bacterium]
MSSRIFVCHAKSDIEATAEIVDLLEIALELPSGSLSSSSLPGYSSDARSDSELREMLDGASVVLALVTPKSSFDPTFCFELGAAWAFGIKIVPLLTQTASVNDLPWPIRDAAAVRPHDRAAWVTFVEDLANLLGVRVRVASAANVALDDVTARASYIPAEQSSTLRSFIPGQAGPVSASKPPRETSEIITLAPIADAMAPAARAADGGGAQPVSGAPASGDAPLSRGLALEAGRAMSDCVWNREEHLDFARELTPQFGRFIDALGGNWNDLRKLGDFDVWIASTDNLIQGLAPAQRELGEWYELGYELTTLHNIAGEDPAGEVERKDQEDVWRETLERFLARAEAAHIRYEDLARVLALLENLIGPRSTRDYTNIARSLEELRKQASYADTMTSAA